MLDVHLFLVRCSVGSKLDAVMEYWSTGEMEYWEIKNSLIEDSGYGDMFFGMIPSQLTH